MVARIKHTFSLLAVLALFNFAATAGLGQQQLPSSPIVTAASSGNVVRVSAAGNITHIRLEVFSATGERVFDSGNRDGSVFDWRWQDEKAPAFSADSYLCVVTVQSLSGKTSRKLANLSFVNQQATLKPIELTQLKSVQAQALSATETDTPLTIIGAEQTIAATVIAHDGNDGQVTRTRGAFTFRFGDFFSGNDQEQMRLTAEGNLGIGTAKPKARLDVAGLIRAREGFQFSDGSTLNVNDKGVLTRTNADGIAPAAVTSTQNRIAKFTDNAGTVGDSVAIDTGTGLQLTAPPNPAVDTNLLYLNSTNGTAGVLAGSTPSYGAANGPFFAMRGNTYTTIANQRGLFTIAAGNVANPVGDDGSVKFNTGNDLLRMIIRPSGNVGINTLVPTEQLHVTGNGLFTGNLTVNGTLNATLPATSISGVLPIDNGGTGSSTQNFVDLSKSQIIHGKKTFFDPIFGDGSQLTNVVNTSTNQSIAGRKVFVDPIFGDGSGLTNVPGTINWQIVSGLSQQALPNTGYLATNDAQVTITLPASPKVGDIVRISGIGMAGWKLAQNDGQFVVAGANPNSPAAEWTAHLPTGPWQSIASSVDGMKLVVCGTDGGTLVSRIYTSTDFGVTWTQRTIAPGVRCSDVASSGDGTKLVTVFNNQQIYTSTNSGESWEPHLSNGSWRGVASSASGNELAAINSGAVYTSSDGGSTWNPPHSFGFQLRAIASSALGDKLVVVGEQIYTSVDYGANWATSESSRAWYAVASSADGSKLVAVVEGGLIYTSTDSGVTWAPRETSRSWRAVASSADGSKLVAATSIGQLYVSTDFGITWVPRSFPAQWTAVAASADGTRLVAAVSGGQIYTSAQNTTLGTEGYLTGGQFTSLELQYIGNGKFLPLSHEGTIVGH